MKQGFHIHKIRISSCVVDVKILWYWEEDGHEDTKSLLSFRYEILEGERIRITNFDIWYTKKNDLQKELWAFYQCRKTIARGILTCHKRKTIPYKGETRPVPKSLGEALESTLASHPTMIEGELELAMNRILYGL